MRRKHGKYARRSFHETSHYKPCEPLSGRLSGIPRRSPGLYHRRAGRSGVRRSHFHRTCHHGRRRRGKNEDRSKNAARIPPAFGSPSAYALNTGTYLTPNLAPGGQAVTGAVINGGSAAVVTPGTSASSSGSTVSSSTGFTEVTSDLYYSGGYLATLKIPAVDLNVKVYQGTGSKTLARGVGHFEETSIWNGNIALAAHNRGTNDYFGEIHTLDIGDRITLATKLGTRTYKVVSVEKISETDRSELSPSAENRLTLYTCVRDQRTYRWCVQAVEA